MIHSVRLGSRDANNSPRPGSHTVFQMQVPVAAVRKLGWRKGDVLSVRAFPRLRGIMIISRTGGDGA